MHGKLNDEKEADKNCSKSLGAGKSDLACVLDPASFQLKFAASALWARDMLLMPELP